MQIEKEFADLIEQTGRLKWRITGFHGKFIPVYLYSALAATPTGMRLSLLFQKRCIDQRRMYQPGCAVYITLGIMRNTDKLTLAALYAALDDYVSAIFMRDALASFLGEAVSEESLFAVFRSLEVQGLVEAYRKIDSQHLAPTALKENDGPDELWFRATPEGWKFVKLEWQRVFSPLKS